LNISPEIRLSHENLSRCSRQFLEFVDRHPQALQSDHYTMLELNDKLFKLQPWPTFINRRTREEMAAVSVKVFNLIQSIPSRLFADDYQKVSAYYRIPPDLARYLLSGTVGRQTGHLLSRGDFVLSPGGLKCLEYNVNTNLGGLQISFWESLYLNTPIIADFLDRCGIRIRNKNVIFTLFQHLLEVARNRSGGSGDEINIAVAMSGSMDSQTRLALEMYYNATYREVLEEHGTHLKGTVVVCDYRQMEVSGGTVRHNGRTIHTIVEWYLGFVPTDMLDVCRQGRVSILNGPLTWLLSTKSNLALLSELADSELFDPEERALIKTYIPWTRTVVRGETTYGGETVRLERFILDQREKLVLKPLLGSGGKDIYIGRYCPREKWQTIVDSAIQGGDWQDLRLGNPVTHEQWQALTRQAMDVQKWLVQEYVASESYLYQWGHDGCAPHSAVWGYFVFGNRYAGSWVRVLPREHDRGVINCHQGAKVSAVFEVDE
jgi:hypothetical protein